MRETQEIIKRIEQLPRDEKAVLATVVDVRGSSYRLPGAKMLVLKTGETYGMVSGGCLESDLLERAKRVLETGAPEVFVYDTTRDEDSVFSLNMGCRGIVRILLEPIDRKSPLKELLGAGDRQRERAAATLIAGGEEEKIGARITYDPLLLFELAGFSDRPDNFLPVREDLIGFLSDQSQRPQLKRYELKEGEFEFFFDKTVRPTELVIYGAGADAVPLSEIAKSLGWLVSVVDHRRAFADRKRFPLADRVIILPPEELAAGPVLGENSVAVLMTHNYKHDKKILRRLLKTDTRYIGVLGPKRRTEKILREFEDEGWKVSDRALENLYAPVGLDLGADTPEGIALSIAAEIEAVLKGRAGGFLRERTGSIYQRD